MFIRNKKLLLGILLLLVPIYGYCHDRTYEMTIDNFIKHNSDMDDCDITLEGIIREYDTYKEIILVMKNDQDQTLGKFIEFNNVFPNAGYFDDNGYLKYQYNHKKHYEVTIFNWLNTVGLRSKNSEYIWHYAPSCKRWNEGLNTIDRSFFEDIIAEGTFEVFFETHQTKWDSNREVRVGKRMVTVTNPDAFEEFLKVPISSHIPFNFRRKLRSAINVLSFDSFFYMRLRRN